MAKPRRSTRQEAKVESGNAHPAKANSRFLLLPLELRLQIYGYIIPRSVKLPPERGNDHVWHRGNINILAVNKQIHDEVAQMIYGDPTFNLKVENDGVVFQYHYPSPCSGVFIQESSAMGGEFFKCIPYMRNLRVQLTPTSEYYVDFRQSTNRYGQPKAGWPRLRKVTTHDGAQTMVAAMDNSMDALLLIIIKAVQIRKLHVNVGLGHLGHCDVEFDKYYLTPLLHLGNVSKLTFGGDISREFQDEVSKPFEHRSKGSPERSIGASSHSNQVKHWKADNDA